MQHLQASSILWHFQQTGMADFSYVLVLTFRALLYLIWHKDILESQAIHKRIQTHWTMKTMTYFSITHPWCRGFWESEQMAESKTTGTANWHQAYEMLQWSAQYKSASGCSMTGSQRNPPIEAEQSNLNGFLASFYWPDYVCNLSTLWWWGVDGWTFTSTMSKVDSETSASFQWQHWHQRCISGLCESGGIPHLFMASASPYRHCLTGLSQWQQQHANHLSLCLFITKLTPTGSNSHNYLCTRTGYCQLGVGQGDKAPEAESRLSIFMQKSGQKLRI